MSGLRKASEAVAHVAWMALAVAMLVPPLAWADEKVARRWTPRGISSPDYESTPTFTPDGREMFFMSSNPSFDRYRILWSRCGHGAWSKPRAPAFAAPPSVLEADPYLTADGRRLYFVSARGSKTPDDLDIWYVDREPGGGWRSAVRLPPPVNSPASELLPRATAEGSIYFGSDRPGGFGQMDIYIARQSGQQATPGANTAADQTVPAVGQWQVENLGPPVNTAANEYEAEVSRDGRTMIVVADRGDRSHLYRFVNEDGRWLERGRVPARPDVFQVGPLLSPTADRLLFAQADGARSGELFLIDLAAQPDASWPPACGDPSRSIR